jgi:CheY-like chemotaxis protein
LQKEQIDAIRSSSEMLLELVNEILDFSKYETGKMNFDSAPFMLNETINELFNSMTIHSIKKQIGLENHIAVGSFICVEGDKMRLKQVIINLLGNAIKFTVKGKVVLYARVEDIDESNVLLKVTIRDTGLGIDKADLPYIFDEFSQVASAQKATRHKGTGLGLAICKKIIELQGGTINVSSEQGKGSDFSFELPLKKCKNMELQASSFFDYEVMASLVANKYVLFAEDNQLNVLLGTTILKKWKIKYDIAYNGVDALELFKKNKYDAVLTDIQMPEMNGLELTSHIRNYPDDLKANTPIVALTANVMKEDRDIYFQSGINDVILKPFLEKNLIEKIAIVMQNENDLTALGFVS